MKTQKTLTLDIEVFLALLEKGENVSKLVNTYLREYLSLKPIETEHKLDIQKKELLDMETKLIQKKQLVEELKEQERKKEAERGPIFKFKNGN